ncbi:MAG: ABC transporter ATP-binding protein [Candidatus Pacearchaeota archaeon]
MREDIVNLFKWNNKELKKDEFWALKGINMTVHRGECIGLYGPNGAGKSTILKLIASVTYPTKGEVKVTGRVAPLIEVGAGFHMDLTGRENIFINGAILGMSIKEIRSKLNDIIEFSELGQFINIPVKKYSSGMYLKLGFSVAVHSFADILLIDEILAVGDEDFQRKCISKVMELKRSGRTIIMVSHNKDMIKKITDDLFIVKSGNLLKGND